MKMYLLLVVIILAMAARGEQEDAPVTLHLPCDSSSPCREMNDPQGNVFNLQTKPVMSFTPENVSEASLAFSEEGRKSVHITLTPEAGEEFAQITRGSVGKILAIVVGDKVIIAPQVRDAITGGTLAIDAGHDKDPDFLGDVPWLQKRIIQNDLDKAQRDRREAILYASIVAVVLVGLLGFAFLRRKKIPA